MSKRVYISADYDYDSGDRNVVNELNRWGADDYHKTDFVDMSKVVSGSVSNNPDCRICDLKAEFNSQINASSAVIFVVGDKTATRTAGSNCERNNKPQYSCMCTPYKQNWFGSKYCKVSTLYYSYDDCSNINSWSYLRHEFEQAKKKGKTIIIVYNSIYNQPSWLPFYMNGYEYKAFPFWTTNAYGNRVGNYTRIKNALGYE